MDDLIKSIDELNKIISSLVEDYKLIPELMKKHNNSDAIVSNLLFYKKVEDEIISNFSKASLEQLNKMKFYNYRYYEDKEYINKLIDQAIFKRIRKDKLDRIKESI